MSEAEPEPQTQRRRPSPGSEDGDFGDGGAGPTQGDSNVGQMVKNLVRLALASEYSRTPIRRADINAKGKLQRCQHYHLLADLGSNGCAITAVQNSLWRSTDTVAGHIWYGDDRITTQRQGHSSTKKRLVPWFERAIRCSHATAAQKSQNAQKSSGAWVLTSILPGRFRDADILLPPQVPTTEAESQYTALYTFVISLICLSGGSLPDNKLDRYLKRANVDETTPFTNSNAFSALDKTEKLLKRMEKDGYVVKIRDNSSGEETIDWVMGSRGKVEVGDVGVRNMVKTVYGDVDDEAELQRKLERSLGVGERRSQKQPNGEGKKRGRKRRNAEAEEQDDEEEGSSSSNEE